MYKNKYCINLTHAEKTFATETVIQIELESINVSLNSYYLKYINDFLNISK